jgi:6-phosphogluconolactonase (cycloisomerase 2 family)
MPFHYKGSLSPVISVFLIVGVLGDGRPPRKSGFEKRTGDARLVKYAPLPYMADGSCVSPDESNPNSNLRTFTPILRKPLRVIKDPFPAFSAVGVDIPWNEVIATDENNFQILVYDREENTPPESIAKPKRSISGSLTEIEFQCGLYIDQGTGDIYSVNNDTKDSMVIFSRKASGNVPPDRWLRTPHGTFGIAVDERRNELFLTVQHDSAIVVYNKNASNREPPIRLLQGNQTRLADPHGIAIDHSRGLIFVANYGATHDVRPRRYNPIHKKNWPMERHLAVPGSGSFHPPSITVYDRTASGNSPPIRIIQGPGTRLNWPTGLTFDSTRNELFVANDMDHSVLVFSGDANGNVAPIRILKGARTQIVNPTGVHLDLEHRELWVANFGDHSLGVFPLNAQGNIPPLRVVRGAPAGTPAVLIGNPGAIAFDTKRKEILVPN